MKEATKLLTNLLSQTKHARKKIYSDQLANEIIFHISMRNIKQGLVKANGVQRFRRFTSRGAVAAFVFSSSVTDLLRSCTASGLV